MLHRFFVAVPLLLNTPLFAEPLSCILEPSLDVFVGAPVEGVVERVEVDRADIVKRGQLLAQLQAGVEQAAVNTQAAREAYARRRIERTEELQQGQLMSQQELDDIRIEYELARLELAERREQLRIRRITSPIEGVVVERFHDPGNLIQKEHLLRIMQLDPLHVEVVLPVEYFGSMKVGERRAVWLQHLDSIHEAKVVVVDRIVDAASSTFRVRLALPNPNYSIPSGLRCEINLTQ